MINVPNKIKVFISSKSDNAEDIKNGESRVCLNELWD